VFVSFHVALALRRSPMNLPDWVAIMRCSSRCTILLVFAVLGIAADVESRRLTHYLPQDFLEKVVRTEDWTEVKLDLKDGVHKGDVIRVWAGGMIDRGNGEQPGVVVNGPEGAKAEAGATFALSAEAGHAYALLVKTESGGIARCQAAGKPLEIKVGKDNDRVWIGLNDERGRFADNHLGRGRRHELDPLWVRIEVVRIVVE
jgi:hypothetical protein